MLPDIGDIIELITSIPEKNPAVRVVASLSMI
jgi:hypothetical protein